MTAKLSAALLKAQVAMPAVKDDAKANYGTYVTLDHLIASTRGILNDHGLVITRLPAVSEFGQPVLRTILMHAKSGESIQADTPLILTQHNMQQLGAAITYARRYAWSAALGIADQEDDDGARASAPPPKPKAAKSPQISEQPEKTGPPPADALASKLFRLADEYKLLVPDFDAIAVRTKAGEKIGKTGYTQWLERQIAAFENNVAQKKAEAQAAEQFPIPEKAKAAA